MTWLFQISWCFEWRSSARTDRVLPRCGQYECSWKLFDHCHVEVCLGLQWQVPRNNHISLSASTPAFSGLRFLVWAGDTSRPIMAGQPETTYSTWNLLTVSMHWIRQSQMGKRKAVSERLVPNPNNAGEQGQKALVRTWCTRHRWVLEGWECCNHNFFMINLGERN